MELKQSQNKIRADIKLLIVGNCGTGKTSFCNRWTKSEFKTKYTATIMTDFNSKIYTYKNNRYKIHLWDIAGQDKNVQAVKLLSKDSLGYLVLYDATNSKSFTETLKWKSIIDENSRFRDGEYLPSILIENKIDWLEKDEKKDETNLQEFAENNNFIKFFRTSVKEDTMINEAMEYLLNNVIDRLEEYSRKNNVPLLEERKSINLHRHQKDQSKQSEWENKKGCC